MAPTDRPGTDPVLQENISVIAELEQEALHTRTGVDRLTDAITHLVGSPSFIAFHVLLFLAWILWNGAGAQPFDPFPFSLLTLMVSLEAIVLTGFVLMSQNRMSRQADKRAHLDLQVNILAERELTAILQMLRQLCETSGIETAARDASIAPLLKDTDIHKIADAIDRELPESDSQQHNAKPQ